MVERIGRREFLKAATLTALALALRGSNRESLQELPGEIRDYIHVPEKTLFNFQTEPDGNVEPYEVETHPEGFYRALRYIARYEDPQDGITKLHRFLQRKPLAIDFVERVTGPFGEEYAHYTPSYWPGGGRLLFTYGFINDDFRVEQRGDLAGRATFDGVNVGHELYHTWQEIRDPVRNMWEGFLLYLWVYTSEEAEERLSHTSLVSFSPSAEESENEIPEIDAEPRRQCWQILLERIRTRQFYPDGHLEHFFTFSRVES